MECRCEHVLTHIIGATYYCRICKRTYPMLPGVK